MVKYLYSILKKEKYEINYKPIVESAIKEDFAKKDITTKLLIEPTKISSAIIIAKKESILCGTEIVKYCFKRIDKSLNVKLLKKDGEKVKRGDVVIRIKGRTGSILKVERIALNFLQHLSGIATYTNKMVCIAKRYNVTILDTRKTLPGLRMLEKYAVYIGGGKNHRFNLKDEVLIKENHTFACGGLENTLNKMKKYGCKFEIEVKDLEDFKIALKHNAPFILLDNFKLRDIKKAVKLNNRKAKLEVSGNITLKNIRKVARTGVDYISVGAITHSAKAADFSLLIE